MKNRRHTHILDIISTNSNITQSDITQKLKESGFNVTQATVSRDIKELGLIKIPCKDDGYKYSMPQNPIGVSSKHISIFSQSVVGVEHALHTVVIKTLSGMAPAAAAAIDSIFVDEMLGCIAGDDTIIGVCSSEAKAAEFKEKLISLRSGGVIF